MKRTINMLWDKKIRGQLFYELKRIWMEMRYYHEFREIYSLVGENNYTEANKKIDELYEINSYYLTNELTRCRTFISFSSGED